MTVGAGTTVTEQSVRRPVDKRVQTSEHGVAGLATAEDTGGGEAALACTLSVAGDAVPAIGPVPIAKYSATEPVSSNDGVFTA